MPTSSELVKQKREAEAWEARMAQLRAAAAGRVKPAPVEEPPVAPLLGPDGQPIATEASDG